MQVSQNKIKTFIFYYKDRLNKKIYENNIFKNNMHIDIKA